METNSLHDDLHLGNFGKWLKTQRVTTHLLALFAKEDVTSVHSLSGSSSSLQDVRKWAAEEQLGQWDTELLEVLWGNARNFCKRRPQEAFEARAPVAPTLVMQTGSSPPDASNVTKRSKTSSSEPVPSLRELEKGATQTWQVRLLELLQTIGLPTRLQGISCDTDALLRRALFGTMRAATLEKLFTQANAWVAYCQASSVSTSKPNLSEVIAYFGDMLHELANGSFPAGGRSVPESRRRGLSKLMTLTDAELHARSHEVKNLVASMQAQLTAPMFRPRQGMPPDAQCLADIERALPSFACLLDRVFAGTILIMVQNSLRFDDILHLDPSTITTQGSTLTGICTQTKTTGTDKKKTCRPVIAQGYWLSGIDWLTPFLQALGALQLPAGRDWFLPEPVWPSRTSFLQRPCSHSAAQSWYRMLLSEIGTPTEKCLLLTLHGLRSVLDSWAAERGIGADRRKFLGCWATEDSADHYVKSSASIISKVVNDVGRSIRDGWQPHKVSMRELEAVQQRRATVEANDVICPVREDGDMESSDSEGPQPERAPPSRAWAACTPVVTGGAHLSEFAEGWIFNQSVGRLHRGVVRNGVPGPKCGCIMALQAQWFARARKPLDMVRSRCRRQGCMSSESD